MLLEVTQSTTQIVAAASEFSLTATPQNVLFEIAGHVSPSGEDTELEVTQSATQIVVESGELALLVQQQPVTFEISGARGPSGIAAEEVSKHLIYLNGRLYQIISSLGTKTLQYDASDRLIQINGTGEYPSKAFVYDGEGRLEDVTLL